jgi:3-hydroxyacyl-[acyl-carrier-protein] dehydratase
MKETTSDLNRSSSYGMGIEEVLKFLPHRQPFLLVDRILEIVPSCRVDDPNPAARVGTRVVAVKNVTYNEPYFAGHFPQFAIVPGVLIVETMAQAASFAVFPFLKNGLDHASGNFRCTLVSVDKARFRRPVVPGDAMRIEATVIKCRSRMWVYQCVVTVDGQKVAEAELMANLSTADGGPLEEAT